MNTTRYVGAAMPENKWCPCCKASLPVGAFGLDRSRPPLYLQGRCRPCLTTAASAARARAVERLKAVPLDFGAELAAINREMECVGVSPDGVLHISMRDRRRRPAVPMNHARDLYNNWRVLLLAPSSRPACVNKNTSH